MNTTLDHLPGRAFWQNDEEWLYFSGTGYLGISHLPAFQKSLLEGIQRYGTNFGGSRSANLQLSIFAEAEAQLAEWAGVEAALTVSSGSLAGQTLIKFLNANTQGSFFMAPNVHPALHVNGYHHISADHFGEWAEKIIQLKKNGQVGPVQIFFSSVDPLFGTHIPLDWLVRLPDHHQYRIIIDDSHGLGILGSQGEGIRALLPSKDNIEYVIVASMGKALGLPGGVIFGTKFLIEEIKNSSFFAGASPMVPAYLYAWQQCREVIHNQRKKLDTALSFVENNWPAQIPLRHQPGYPVFCPLTPHLSPVLEKERIHISAFPYPDHTGPIIERIVVNALHTKDDLERLIAVLEMVEYQD